MNSYLQQAGLSSAVADAELPAQVAKWQQQLAAVQQQALQLQQWPSVSWTFPVPELGEGGACSLFGQLADTPYDLTAILGGQTAANQQLLAQLSLIVQFYQQHSQSHWFGIYQSRPNVAGEPVLVKLAYFGAPSRAEFPLTPEFATISNNSTVGLTGQGKIINDIPAYVATGGEYYTCDPKVQAEACLPVLARDGRVLGIIDSEAFVKDLYSGRELALLLAVATSLSQLLD